MHAEQIEDYTAETRHTESGITVLQIDHDLLPKIVPPAIKKKLLAHSALLITEGIEPPWSVALYDETTQQFTVPQPSVQKNDLVLLSTCHQGWLFARTHFSQKKMRAPFPITNKEASYRIAPWHTTLWFAMQNNQQGYGIYRLRLPNEKTPVEIISDVSAFQANAVLNHHSVPAQSTTDWSQVHCLRITLQLKKNHAILNWPISLVVKSGIPRPRSV